jgi:tetrahydrodipicolinate N-succinyltransferase
LIPSRKPVLTSESWSQFFDLVAETRRYQAHYRRTIDPRARRMVAELETRLDATIVEFASVMHAAAVEVEAEVLGVSTIAEGGVS